MNQRTPEQQALRYRRVSLLIDALKRGRTRGKLYRLLSGR